MRTRFFIAVKHPVLFSGFFLDLPPLCTFTPRLLDQLRQAALAHFGRPESGQPFADCIRHFSSFLVPHWYA
jgi:hypothetical protein